jgi:transposase InsO family protein
MSISTEAQAALDTVREALDELHYLTGSADAPTELGQRSYKALHVLARELERLEGYLQEAERDVVTYRTERDEALDLLKDAEAAEAERARADRLAEALRRIAGQQTNTLDWLRANGVVFDALDEHWQTVAFWIYNDLCEVDTWAHQALGEGLDGKPLAEHNSPEEARP